MYLSPTTLKQPIIESFRIMERSDLLLKEFDWKSIAGMIERDHLKKRTTDLSLKITFLYRKLFQQ
jgi:hypothetical protein